MFTRALATGTVASVSLHDGWWDCASLDEMIERLTRYQAMAKLGSPRDVIHVARAKLTTSSAAQGGKVGQQHYDLGNDLYEAMPTSG